jgi:hypothetical protein
VVTAWQVIPLSAAGARLAIAGLIAVGLGLYVYLLAREALGVSRRKE